MERGEGEDGGERGHDVGSGDREREGKWERRFVGGGRWRGRGWF